MSWIRCFSILRCDVSRDDLVEDFSYMSVTTCQLHVSYDLSRDDLVEDGGLKVKRYMSKQINETTIHELNPKP